MSRKYWGKCMYLFVTLCLLKVKWTSNRCPCHDHDNKGSDSCCRYSMTLVCTTRTTTTTTTTAAATCCKSASCTWASVAITCITTWPTSCTCNWDTTNCRHCGSTYWATKRSRRWGHQTQWGARSRTRNTRRVVGVQSKMWSFAFDDQNIWDYFKYWPCRLFPFE